MTTPKVIALTGGTGFVGSNVLSHLLAAGFQVRLLTRNSQHPFPASTNIEVVDGDLQNHAALKKLITGCQSIVHCAGRVRGKNFSEFEIDNSIATQTLHKLTATSSEIKNFIYISSLAARHPHLSNYAKSKKLGEDALKTRQNSIIIRPPALYGPNDTELRPVFDGLKKGINLVPGNQANKFSLLHVSDLCEIIQLGLNDKLPFNKIYEPDDGKSGGYQWSEINEIATQVFQRKIHSITIPKLMLKGLAHTNVLFSAIKNSAPMLTPDKVNELCFPDWVASPKMSIPHWHASIDFKLGLKNLYSSKN